MALEAMESAGVSLSHVAHSQACRSVPLVNLRPRPCDGFGQNLGRTRHDPRACSHEHYRVNAADNSLRLGAAAAQLTCRQLQCLEKARSGRDSAAVDAVAVVAPAQIAQYSLPVTLARNAIPVTNSAGPASWPAGNA